MSNWSEYENIKRYCPNCGSDIIWFFSDQYICSKCESVGLIEKLSVVDTRGLRRSKLKNLKENILKNSF